MPLIGLTPITEASIALLPATGKYFVFLDSDQSDYLYKIDSAGVITSATDAFTNPMTTLGDVIYGAGGGVGTRLGIGTAGQVLTVAGGLPSWATPSAGTVTTLSVASANGFTGTVANATTTPAITLTTSITGVLIGNGTALTTNANFVYDGASNSFNAGAAATGVVNIDGTLSEVSIGLDNGTRTGIFFVDNLNTLLNYTADAGVTNYGFAGTSTGTKIYVGTTVYTLPTDGTANQVLKTNGSGVLSWATASSGISVGTTTITTGGSTATSRRIGYNLGGVYQEALNELYFETASPFAHVFAAGRTGVITGVRNSLYGYKAGELITSSTDNAIFGYNAGVLITTSANNYNSYFGAGSGNNTGAKNTGIGYIALQNGTGSENTAVGYTSQSVGTGNGTLNSSLGSQSLLNRTSGNRNVAIGAESLVTLTSGSFNVALGYAACYTGNLSGTLGIGYFANPVTSNTGVIGSNQSEGRLDAIYFNSPTSSGGSIYHIILSGSGGSGTNAASANMSLQGGAPTGTSTTGGALNLRGYTALGSGSTAQTATTVLQITNATTVTVSDAVNFVFNATTGTKFGTATSQKQAFWNKTPIVQPTTAIASAAVSHIGGSAMGENDTIGGYTIAQVVQALQNIGLLA